MDQIALIELLAKFKTNATETVKTELTASKDIKVAVLDTLIGFAKTLVDNNINQENFKDTSKVITAEGITELNAVYTAVVKDFSKLVLDFYKKKKSLKANLFSYAAILKTVKGNGNTPPPPPAPDK
jgi:methyltransferase-like protein